MKVSHGNISNINEQNRIFSRNTNKCLIHFSVHVFQYYLKLNTHKINFTELYVKRNHYENKWLL